MAVKPRCYLEVNAGNDVNGNPRRAAIVFGFDDEHPNVAVLVDVVDVADEGYAGYPEWIRGLAYLGQFPVSVRRYKAYLARTAVTS